jgi:oxygen-independent coproporphyrinogen-3 oxidase
MYLYLHVPFCVSHCIYCDFFVVLEKYGGQTAYVEALLREIEVRLPQAMEAGLTGEVETVYIGGGTPSLLPAEAYDRILRGVQTHVPMSPQVEITMEANPEGVVDDPAAYREVGINRISVGVQSFVDAELKKLSRVHSAQSAMACISAFQAAGLTNLSIDLMYGTPAQTDVGWDETLTQAIALDVPHVSMYGLKVEPETPLAKLAGHARYPMPTDEETVNRFFTAVERLEAAGLLAYEFANLARPGFESRHNLNYWANGYYLGLGVSAHGYLPGRRTENPRDLAAYLADPIGHQTTTPVTPEDRLEEALMLGLRRRDGVEIAAIEAEFGISFEARYGPILKKYAPEGWLTLTDGRLRLSRSAIPLSNELLSEFFR